MTVFAKTRFNGDGVIPPDRISPSATALLAYYPLPNVGGADGTNFQDQTLRQVVHTSIGGESVRIRISNAFGTQPLTVDSVHVAKRTTGSSIDTASDKQLAFAGKGSVTIPAGQVATSDSVAFAVAALSDLAVSFHVQGSPGTTTAHGTGLQDNYVAPGNVAESATLAATTAQPEM